MSEVKQGRDGMTKRRRTDNAIFEEMKWSIALIISLVFGIGIGATVIGRISKHEATAMQAKLDDAIMERDELKAELKFCQRTLRDLIEGGQLKGVELRPSTGD